MLEFKANERTLQGVLLSTFIKVIYDNLEIISMKHALEKFIYEYSKIFFI